MARIRKKHSPAFKAQVALEAAKQAVSMDGRGRALDNVFVERLWRSLKYEEVHLKDYRSVAELVSGLRSWCRG